LVQICDEDDAVSGAGKPQHSGGRVARQTVSVVLGKKWKQQKAAVYKTNGGLLTRF